MEQAQSGTSGKCVDETKRAIHRKDYRRILTEQTFSRAFEIIDNYHQRLIHYAYWKFCEKYLGQESLSTPHSLKQLISADRKDGVKDRKSKKGPSMKENNLVS